MVKLTYSTDISDSVGVGGEVIKSASELKKQASTIFNCEYDELKPPEGKTGIHLVALGEMETYGFNRNADGFKQADCRDRCDTFVKHGHVFQHHRNKDPEKAIGEIKCAAYNPDMHRVELYIWADNEKAHDHLERLEKTGEVPFSMACVREGTPIMTSDGFKSVEKIEAGDFVLTHLGNWKRVHDTMSRTAENYCKVSFVSWGQRVLEITPNHQVYAASFDDIPREFREDRAVHPDKGWRRRHRNELHKVAKWVPAGDLTKYHYMCVPVTRGSAEGIGIDRARLYGYYTAEGSLSSGCVQITCNAKDCFVDEIERLAPWTSVKKKAHRLSSENCVVITCFSTEIRNEIEAACGRRSENKRIPQAVRFGSIEEKFNYAAAWFNGDGWQDATGLHWSIHAANLANDLQVLLSSIGIPSSCTKILHKEKRGHIVSKDPVEYVVTVSNEHSSLFVGISKAKEIDIFGKSKLRTFISGNYMFIPVDHVELINEPTKVYNFSVEDDESYTVYGLSVHNCRVPSDTCSYCGATRTGPGDPKECEHIKYQLGKIAEDGKFIGMINNDPTWFDISFVGRPADRIAWNLKTASGLIDSVKEAEAEGIVAPDSVEVTSDTGLRKLALMKDLSDMSVKMSGWLKKASFESVDERRLFEMRKVAAMTLPRPLINTLREHSPRDAFEALADAGVVLDAPSFFKYAMGPEYSVVKPYIRDIEKATSKILTSAVKEGSCARFCNSTDYDIYPKDDLRRKPLPSRLVEKIAEYGCDNAAEKIVDLTLSGSIPTFSVDDNSEKSVLSSVSIKLAEKYIAYKLAAVDAVLNSRYGISRTKNNLAAISAAQDLKRGEIE